MTGEISHTLLLTLGVADAGLEREGECLVADCHVLVLVGAGAGDESRCFGRNVAAVRHVLVHVRFSV